MRPISPLRGLVVILIGNLNRRGLRLRARLRAGLGLGSLTTPAEVTCAPDRPRADSFVTALHGETVDDNGRPGFALRLLRRGKRERITSREYPIVQGYRRVLSSTEMGRAMGRLSPQKQEEGLWEIRMEPAFSNDECRSTQARKKDH